MWLISGGGLIIRIPVRRRMTMALCLVAVLSVVVLGSPPEAGAEPAPIVAELGVSVTSFDGTQLNVNFFPATGLTSGQTAPTVLEGSGWGLPAYPGSIGHDRLDRRRHPAQFGAQLLGPATLTADGYNVVTWDNRGWYGSGGQVNLDSPAVEGRDVTAIINWLATQPGAELKGPNDPVVGMTGASYGGGIQLSAAAIDHRIAAIEPNMSWYSLVDSAVSRRGDQVRLGQPPLRRGRRSSAPLRPEVTKLCASAQSGDRHPRRARFGQRRAPDRIGQITTPTLLLAGTVDTLFPINGDIDTYDALRAAGTPVR